MKRSLSRIAWAIAGLLVVAGSALADDTEALAKAAQNPIAAMISLPFQNNTTLNAGPEKQTLNVLDIQPVIPIKLDDDWNLISRTILPVDLAAGIRARAGAGQRHRRHSRRAVLLSRQAREADLGRGTGPATADQFKRCARHEEMGNGSGGRVAHERRSLAVRRGRQQHLVDRRTGRCRADQPDAGPVLHQLQLFGRLVRDHFAGHHGQLESSPTTTDGRCRSAAGSARSSRSETRR